MGNRHWRVAANFHCVGDVVVLVVAPNLTGGIRKGALAIKGLPELKGRRLKAGSFTVVEVEAPVQTVASEQLPLASGEPQDSGEGGQTPPSTTE